MKLEKFNPLLSPSFSSMPSQSQGDSTSQLLLDGSNHVKNNYLMSKQPNNSAGQNPREHRRNDVLIEGMGNDLLSAKLGDYYLDRADEEDDLSGDEKINILWLMLSMAM
jgi:hypothetical protein